MNTELKSDEIRYAYSPETQLFYLSDDEKNYPADIVYLTEAEMLQITGEGSE
ncbi:hypothetical protein [Pectobacterium cacticida]|uniref:hypothetical protein n=1 Tax=Pectobacterium cacticida TaxID=69221 RepID=UPI002FF0B1B9